MATLAAPNLATTGASNAGQVFTNNQNLSHGTGFPVITRPMLAAPGVFSLINTTTGTSI